MTFNDRQFSYHLLFVSGFICILLPQFLCHYRGSITSPPLQLLDANFAAKPPFANGSGDGQRLADKLLDL